MRLAHDVPVPRTIGRPYEEFVYRLAGEWYYLPEPRIAEAPFFETLLSRRTRRTFGPVDEEHLSALLWFTAKTLATRRGAVPRRNGPYSQSHWEHRVTPSAGGRHPIDVVVMRPSVTGAGALSIYDPISHALGPLESADELSLANLSEAVRNVVPPEDGAILWHVAQPQRTFSRYEAGESLLWRDVGCLVATTALVAEALGLACCPLGITGAPDLVRVLGDARRLAGVGGCIIGTRRTPDATDADTVDSIP